MSRFVSYLTQDIFVMKRHDKHCITMGGGTYFTHELAWGYLFLINLRGFTKIHELWWRISHILYINIGLN